MADLVEIFMGRNILYYDDPQDHHFSKKDNAHPAPRKVGDTVG